MSFFKEYFHKSSPSLHKSQRMPVDDSPVDWTVLNAEKFCNPQCVEALKELCLAVLNDKKVKIRNLYSTRLKPEKLEQEIDPITRQLKPGSGFKRGDLEMYMSQELALTEMIAKAKAWGWEEALDSYRIKTVINMTVALSIQKKQWKEMATDQSALEIAPALRLVRWEPRENERDWKTRWRKAATTVDWDGVFDGDRGATPIAFFHSPIWSVLSRFGHPYPPFDYDSGMGIERVFDYELDKLGWKQWERERPPPKPHPRNISIDVSDLSKDELQFLMDGLGDIATMKNGKLHIRQKNRK